MSKATRLGYTAEHAVEVYLRDHGYPCYRPRAGTTEDHGDLLGLLVTVSVKNHARLDLAEWIKAMLRMRTANAHETGMVWHKRRGKADPADWYVTMTGADLLPLLHAYRALHEHRAMHEHEDRR